jgi:uncharacterized protein YqeY
MNIDKLILCATKDKVSAAKEAYRAIKAELLLNNSSKNPKAEGKVINTITFAREGEEPFKIEINELDLSIIKKQIQIREEQIAMYDANSRKDLADMYREQMKYLKELLPPEISKEKIQEFITTAYPNGYPQKEMKQVINKVVSVYPTADKKTVATLVKEHIV